MRPFLTATRIYFTAYLARVLRTRRAWLVIALALVPCAVGFMLGHFVTKTPAVDLATHIGWACVLQLLVPLTCLIAGSAVIAEEVEDRTITYLFVRPVSRAALLVGRWAGACAFLLVVLCSTTALMLLGVARAEASGPPIDASITVPLFAAVAIGACVYSMLFSVFGILFPHSMIVGLGYCFAIEGLIANLPGGIRTLSIQHHLRAMITAEGSPAWTRVLQDFGGTVAPSESALASLAVVFVASLALGVWRIQRREFLLTS